MKPIFRKIDWNNINIKDEYVLLEWANDMLDQKINTSEPITEEQHQVWIKDRLNSSHLWIVEVDRISIGQVRIDRKKDNEWHVDLYITKVYRGHNLGYKAIEHAISYWRDTYLNSIFVAVVKSNNIPSQTVFESHRPDYTNKQKNTISYIWDNNEEILKVTSDYQI